MNRKHTVTLGALAAVVGTALMAVAASVHFIGGPTFTDNGVTLTGCGKLAGLGNGDITITLTGSGPATYTCTNQGGTQAPGQNKNNVTTSGVTTIPASQIKNGTVSFCTTTLKPAIPSARQAGCPNRTWTAAITDIKFTSATFTVVQGGQTVLKRSYVP